MFITSFGEQNITYRCCSNFLIHLYIHEWGAFKADIMQGDYWISGMVSAYTNALWGRGRVKNYSDNYDVVENIDAIYLGHTIVKEMTRLDNCYYIDVGSSFTQKLCITKIK